MLSLRICPELEIDKGLVFYKEANKGWYLNRGVLFGVQKGAQLSLVGADNTAINGIVIAVGLEDAPIEFSEGQLLEVAKVYPIDTTC